jgi:AcrR family transcriptional regulator
MNVAVSTKPNTKQRSSSERAARTRLKIIDAFRALVYEGPGSPRMRDVAQRAGVSLRTVFHHFHDVETLYEEVIRILELRVSRLIEAQDTRTPLHVRVRRLVTQRCAVYRTIAPLRRAVLASPEVRSSPSIAAYKRRLDYVLSRNTSETLSPELRRAADRYGSLERITAVTSYEMWSHLSSVQRLSPSRVERHMTIAVMRELAG